MPELPEVETIKRQLETSVIGESVSDILIKTPGIVEGDLRQLMTHTIIGVRRFSKLLVIDFTGSLSLVVHLKMTGRLIFDSSQQDQRSGSWDIDYPHNKHTHVTLQFMSGSSLYFHDYRKFGVVVVVPSSEVLAIPYVKTLGKEFLKDLRFEDFMLLTAQSKRPIKTVLLDQSLMAGVGNIYANEALWEAQLNPEMPANAIQRKNKERLFRALESVMTEAIRYLGASSDNFRNLFGQPGQAQEHFSVYGRQGQACPRCGATIKKIMVGQRGTYVCPECQKNQTD